jgi:hypothetical protein
MACQGFFCRSYRELSTAEKRVILGTITDWFLFGLVISDVDFTQGFFRLAEERLGRHIDPAELAVPPASALVNAFFHWKIDWPYRNSGSELKPFKIPEALGTKQNVGGQEPEQPTLAPLDMIFISLDSKFRSCAERKSAENKISQLFSRLSRVVQKR